MRDRNEARKRIREEQQRVLGRRRALNSSDSGSSGGGSQKGPPAPPQGAANTGTGGEIRPAAGGVGGRIDSLGLVRELSASLRMHGWYPYTKHSKKSYTKQSKKCHASHTSKPFKFKGASPIVAGDINLDLCADQFPCCPESVVVWTGGGQSHCLLYTLGRVS